MKCFYSIKILFFNFLYIDFFRRTTVLKNRKWGGGGEFTEFFFIYNNLRLSTCIQSNLLCLEVYFSCVRDFAPSFSSDSMRSVKNFIVWMLHKAIKFQKCFVASIHFFHCEDFAILSFT